MQENIVFANKMLKNVKSHEEGQLSVEELGKLAVEEAKKLKSYNLLP